MLIHYIKSFWRTLWRNKVFSLINATGLTVGITCCILIFLYVKFELSYDTFHHNKDRLVRVIMEYSMGGSSNKGNYTSTYVGPSFKKNFPEVEEFVRMTSSKKIVRNGEKVFVEDRFVYADSTFFKLFSFRLLQGQEQQALSGPNKVILTRSALKKYFGTTADVLEKTIKVSSAGTEYMITGIMEDCPQNSQIKFDFIASFSSLGEKVEATYWNANFITYLLLKQPSSVEGLQEKIPGFMKKEMSTVFTGNDYLSFILEPLLQIHLHSDHPGFEVNGSISYVYSISAVALLVLVIACFTFVNLSTARSVERAKEIGIRKVTGAVRLQIFWQFISESAFIVTISALLSLLAGALLLPYFNTLMARQLSITGLISLPVLSCCLLIILTISLFAGAYPALILSGFQPVKVLKGAFKNSNSGLFVRKSLFVFQFVVSVFLIICTVVIQAQLHFIQHKKLGFDKDHVLVLPYDSKVHEKFAGFRSELLKDANIRSIAKGDFDPCNILGGYSMQKPEMGPGKSFAVFAGTIDEHYLATCGIKLVAGKDLTEQDIKDASQDDYTKNYFHFILNRSAARQMGWEPEEAIGKKMSLDPSRPGEVKAVVEDFHFSSMHESIKPLVLFPGNYATRILVKLNGAAIGHGIAHTEKTWRSVISHRPFEYAFLDERYNALYTSEMNLGRAMNVFTALAVLLACLGLFGLSSYNIQQRTKEIGILKVLGAPVLTIVTRLSRGFLLLVLIAILISIPLAWLVMDSWLEDFAYRISLGMPVFALSALAAFVVALLTISFKALRAANTNPVKSLRTE